MPYPHSARHAKIERRQVPSRSRIPFFVVAACSACSTHGTSRAPSDGRSIVVTKSGDTTEVSVNDAPDPQNPACVDYCRRLATCWYAVPSRTEGMSEADVYRACLSEQNDCRTPTTETFCCAAFTDCQAFVHCQTRSHDVVSDCSRDAPRW